MARAKTSTNRYEWTEQDVRDMAAGKRTSFLDGQIMELVSCASATCAKRYFRRATVDKDLWQEAISESILKLYTEGFQKMIATNDFRNVRSCILNWLVWGIVGFIQRQWSREKREGKQQVAWCGEYLENMPTSQEEIWEYLQSTIPDEEPEDKNSNKVMFR